MGRTELQTGTIIADGKQGGEPDARARAWRGVPLVELTSPSLRGWQLAIKRLFDVIGSIVGLVIAAPVTAAIALAIKVDSPGSVLFAQERVGRGGGLFRLYKFRTMVAGAEAQRDLLAARRVYPDPRLFKVPDDPRMTSVGLWLRRVSLDELPQLFNVLRGEMSLVGPRLPLPSEVALYEAHDYARFDVTPGITGPWQVGGRNAVTDFEQVVALESGYVRNRPRMLDLGILLRTIPAVLRRTGAY